MEENYKLGDRIPEVVTTLAKRVGAAGGELYVVGGWVRDYLMEVEPGEVDLATNLSPAEIRKALEGLGSIYDIGEKFGTVCLSSGQVELEITTFRSEDYTPGSRHPEVLSVSTVEEDLSRRDFTVNAIAFQIAPESGRLGFSGRYLLSYLFCLDRLDLGQNELTSPPGKLFSAFLRFSVSGLGSGRRSIHGSGYEVSLLPSGLLQIHPEGAAP